MEHGLSLLPRYKNILLGDETAAYLVCKNQTTDYTDAMTTTELWTRHNNPHPSTGHDHHNLLDLKCTIADRILSSCTLCERRCHTDRHRSPGACHTQDTCIATEFIHHGEEPPLTPSHTIFFSGCPLHCAFCQNGDISQTATGTTIPPPRLAQTITQRHTQGARNVNWVGGDPTPNLPYILTVLSHLNLNIPQIWNSNMYCSHETMQLLAGTIDLYLTDYKFGNDTCARRLADAPNYTTVVQRNHLHAAKTGDILIRHLLLPHHTDCCTKPILDWIATHLPTAAVNIMAQYHPDHHATDHPDLQTTITTNEYHTALDYADTLGLHHI